MAFRFTGALDPGANPAGNQERSYEHNTDTPFDPAQERSAPSAPPTSEGTQTPSHTEKSTPPKPAKAAAGQRAGRKSSAVKGSEPTKRCQIGVWISPGERRSLRSLCVNNDTNITSFAAGALLDAMRYTYECTNPGCRCQFTLRSKDDAAPEKAVSCPVCGQKVSAIRY